RREGALVKDDLDPAGRGVDALVRAQVPFDELHVVLEAGQVCAAAGREVVEDADLVAAREERPHDVRPDEPAATRDESLHLGVSARTWKFAKSPPGPGSLSRVERPSMPMATELIPATSGRAARPSPTRRNPRSRYIAKSIPRQAVVPEAA